MFPSKEQSREPQNRWGPGGVLRSGVPHSCQQYSRGLGSSQASALHCRELANDRLRFEMEKRWGTGTYTNNPISLEVEAEPLGIHDYVWLQQKLKLA